MKKIFHKFISKIEDLVNFYEVTMFYSTEEEIREAIRLLKEVGIKTYGFQRLATQDGEMHGEYRVSEENETEFIDGNDETIYMIGFKCKFLEILKIRKLFINSGIWDERYDPSI